MSASLSYFILACSSSSHTHAHTNTNTHTPSLVARHVMTSAAAQKILSLERRGKVELELRQQHLWKSSREQEAKDLEALAHQSLLEQQEVSLAKERQREALAAAKRSQVQVSLREQLAEREYAVMVEEETKALEGQHILAAVRAQEAKAVEARAAKLEFARKSALEVAEANRAFAARDLARAEAAAEEERMIVEYMRAKEAQERELDERRKAEKASKDALGSKLSVAAKRLADGQAALDEARNRRHWESVELASRAKAKAALEAKERGKRELFESISRQVSCVDCCLIMRLPPHHHCHLTHMHQPLSPPPPAPLLFHSWRSNSSTRRRHACWSWRRWRQLGST